MKILIGHIHDVIIMYVAAILVPQRVLAKYRLGITHGDVLFPICKITFKSGYGAPLIPYDSNFCRRMLWLTVPKAFEKSKKMPHVFLSIRNFSYSLGDRPSLLRNTN